MINEIAIEREHKRKSSLYTFIIHLSILLLAFFSTCEYHKAVDNQYSVALNFEEIIPPKLEEMSDASNSNKGQEAEGKAREKADRPAEILDQQTKTIENNRPEVKLPTPTPTPPTPTTDPIISETTIDEESDVTAAEEEIEIDAPEMEEIPDPVVVEKDNKDTPSEEKAKESVKDKIGKILDVFKTGGSKDNGNPKGEPSNKDGSSDGTGKGNNGTGQGSDKSGNDGDSGVGTGGTGEGQYDGSGNGIFGRKVIKRNISDVMKVGFENQENKKIVYKVCINREGNVSYAEFLNMESTAAVPRGKEKDLLKAIQGYKYEPNPRAPSEECGKLTIILSNISALTTKN